MGRIGICLRVLDTGERYWDASIVLQGVGVDVDAWQVVPAGLFIEEEQVMIWAH
jgi:hypothetical protein